MKRSKILASAFFLLITLIIAILAYRWLFIPKGIGIDKHQYPVTGIDVSKHTGTIDWNLFTNHAIDFVYIKATEGISYVDPFFTKNLRGARLHKIPAGAYHFFRFGKKGEDQARNFLKNSALKELDLPPVLDVEEWGNLHSKRKTDEIVLEISQFIRTVELKSKKKVIIYANESSYRRFIQTNFPENEIWICSLDEEPQLDRRWTFWQHSHKAEFEAAKGWFDINTFNGNKDDWNHYLKK
jgi:lysozyme